VEGSEDVRVFVRDRGKAERLFGSAVDIHVGDLADAGSLRAALAGADQLFLSCADDPRRVEWETRAIDDATAAGVQRIVKLSSIVAEPGTIVDWWDWHGQIEQHLRASTVPSVVIRSSFFMSNLLAAAGGVAQTGRLFAPAGQARIAMIDPRDVGDAVAAVMAARGHDGRTYVLTGPEAITYERVAIELTVATGAEVQFVDVPDEAALHGMVEAGLPDVVAQQIVNVFVSARAGVAEQVTPTVASLTGRAPRGIACFAHVHAAAFAPAAGRDGRAA
jgi:uncharacterized protein YbjT (DUF2867 family)